MVLGKGQKEESCLYLEQEVNGVPGEVVEATGTLLMVVDGQQWKILEIVSGKEIVSD